MSSTKNAPSGRDVLTRGRVGGAGAGAAFANDGGGGGGGGGGIILILQISLLRIVAEAKKLVSL